MQLSGCIDSANQDEEPDKQAACTVELHNGTRTQYCVKVNS